MFKVKIITVGTLKEKYIRDACAEYVKRLSPYAQVEICELKESRLSEAPAQSEIDNALQSEGAQILAAIPARAHSIALCVEGNQITSERLAQRLIEIQNSASCLCFIIGSSYGLSETVKRACDERLSFSKMTFPHQLMRVLLLEQVYRGFMINGNRTYHK